MSSSSYIYIYGFAANFIYWSMFDSKRSCEHSYWPRQFCHISSMFDSISTGLRACTVAKLALSTSYSFASIHIGNVELPKHTVTRASMPKAYPRSRSDSIYTVTKASMPNACPRSCSESTDQRIQAQSINPFVFQRSKHSPASVSRACGDQRIHARSIISYVSQEHAVTRVSMRIGTLSFAFPEQTITRACPTQNTVRVPKGYGPSKNSDSSVKFGPAPM